MSTQPGFCDSSGRYGCQAKGMCPLPGYYRNGYCEEPNGTHKVCAQTDAATLEWFKSVGNDLSSVVAPGMGWCLCKHWTRGAICCNDFDISKIDLPASDTSDPDVDQLRDLVTGKIDKKQFCCNKRFPVAGCKPSMCGGTMAGGSKKTGGSI